MSQSGRTPRTAEVIQRILDDFSADLMTACPGVCESYDPGSQTAVIKPMIKRVGREGPDQERVVDELPSLPAVPVAWLRAGGYFLTFPLAAGDSGLLVFAQRPMGSWRDSGQVSDPGDEGTHTIASAVFFPGLETVAKKLPGAEGGGAGHAVLGKSGGPTLHIDDSTVQIGDAGGSYIALANLVEAELNAIKSAFEAWVPVPATPTTPDDGGAALKTAINAWTPGNVGATIAKAT
jgi:hypothetical protein